MPDGLQEKQSTKSARLLPSNRPGFSYASQVREEVRRCSLRFTAFQGRADRSCIGYPRGNAVPDCAADRASAARRHPGARDRARTVVLLTLTSVATCMARLPLPRGTRRWPVPYGVNGGGRPFVWPG